MDKLSEQDAKMLRDAIDAMREPQAVLSFVQRHLALAYGIGPADKVNPQTGEITRATE